MTLYAINIGGSCMNNLTKTIIFAIAILVGIGILSHLVLNKELAKVTCIELEEGYQVTLYDKRGKVFFELDTPVQPGITDLASNITEISISVGSPARYVLYYDRQNCKMSDVYFNPILIDNKYIAYMEECDLIIRDLFNREILCKRIVRDFAKTADAMSAVMSIQCLEEENFVINYLKGEDYESITEIVPIVD